MHTLIVLAGAVLAAALVAVLTRVLARHVTRRQEHVILELTYRACQWAWLVVLVIAAAFYALPATKLKHGHVVWIRHLLLVGLIVALGWLVLKFLHVIEDVVFQRLPTQVANDRRKRARTQIALMRRLTAALVVALAVGWALTTFSTFRTLGKSLLLSAGVVGVLVGLAANSLLGQILAGVQLAFADALRVDDVLVVDGERGRVEDVQLTHIVIRKWDRRRLIVPSNYLTSKPFENWTHDETRVLGEVTLHLDFTVDLDELRRETERIVQASSSWDRQEWQLLAVDSTINTMVIQVLVSAADGGRSWSLRAELREALYKYVREQHPQWLPRTRAQYQP